MFTVRTIYLGSTQFESHPFDLIPANAQAEQVCSVVAEFLADKPNEFRAMLPFMKRGAFELEWSAGAGGVALASFFEAGQPLSMNVLLTGVKPEEDAQMLNLFREHVLQPIFGEGAEPFLNVAERPVMLSLAFPDAPEWLPGAQLISTALASVFFRCMLQLHEEEQSAGPA